MYIDVDRSQPLSTILPILSTTTGAHNSGATVGVAIDGTAVQPTAAIADSGLREGSLVALLGTGPVQASRTRVPAATNYVRVVSGQGAGDVYAIEPGIVTIGRSAGADIVVTDDESHDIEMGLIVDHPGAVTVALAVDKSCALVNGNPIQDGQTLERGSQIAFADRILEVGMPALTVAALEDEPASGKRKYNRPPRILPPEEAPAFRLPQEPQEPEKAPLPILMSLLPLAMAAGLAYLYKNPLMMTFALMSPVMLFGSYMTNRKTGRRKYRKQIVEYRDVKAQTEEYAAMALITEREQRLVANPDPTLVGMIATYPASRLWERRVGDETWLRLRLGTATQPSNVTLDDPEQLQHKQHVVWDIHDAPVTVDLPTSGVIGLASVDGHIERPRQIAQWMAAQVGVLHSPKDVQLYLLEGYAEPASPRLPHPWDFLTWLPHTVPETGQTLRTIATTTSILATRIAELSALIDARVGAMSNGNMAKYNGPSVVVILDGASRLRPMPGLVRILKEGPRYGIYAICVERDERLLPEECDTVLVVKPGRSVIRRQKHIAHSEILPDWVSPSWLDWTTRAIAPIVDISPDLRDGALPSVSRLLDVLNLPQPDSAQIQARWTLNSRSTTAVVGESLDGPFSLDLVADGPHGLIAGTTGSGKSEFLQTIVASLAVVNSPEEMNFVLIDYKGGAAFKDCEFLPHTVGMVTDLDAHLVERALESLNAELRYREHILSEAGAKDIEDYQDLASTKGLTALPRLLVVADEFASLIRELPDFVHGLINLAQRGRSLGIHLLLATQRPGGSVSPEIRANTNLRVALRMTDATESADVIDSPEAGSISKTTPGRAYARLGANSLIPFQASRVGGRAPETTHVEEALDPLIRPIPFTALGKSTPERPRADKGRGNVEVTDLKLVVAAIQDAAHIMGLAAQREPWLPALPTTIDLHKLTENSSTQRQSEEIWYGIEDHPHQQAQAPAKITLRDFGHLYVVGASRSGKTTALRSIATSAALSYSAADIHFYVIDCGNGGLLPLRTFPHTGAVILRHESNQVARLIGKLCALVTKRQEQLALAGVSTVTELRAIAEGAHRPALIFVIIDGWDAFVSNFADANGGALMDGVLQLFKEGASAGVHMIISGDRQLLTNGRMSTLAESKIILRLIEKSDYAFAGISPRALPDTISDGRAFVAGTGIETQIAIFEPDLTPQEQSQGLSALGDTITERDASVPLSSRPFRVIEMPSRYTYETALHHYARETPAGSLFVGIGGEDVQPFTVNPRKTPTYIITGSPASGRSNALLCLATGAIAAGYDLAVLTPRSSPLRTLAGQPNVKAIITGTSVSEDDLKPLLVATPRPTLLVVDDADLLRDIDADKWLRTLIPQAAELGIGFFLAGDGDALSKGFAGWLSEARKARQGMVMRPREMLDGDAPGVKLSRSDIAEAADAPLGRGYTHDDDGSTTLIHVPLMPLQEEL